MKKNNPVNAFDKPFSAGLWKNMLLIFLSLCDVEKGYYYNKTALCFGYVRLENRLSEV